MYCRHSTCGGGDKIGIVLKPIVSLGLINTFVAGFIHFLKHAKRSISYSFLLNAKHLFREFTFIKSVTFDTTSNLLAGKLFNSSIILSHLMSKRYFGVYPLKINSTRENYRELLWVSKTINSLKNN